MIRGRGTRGPAAFRRPGPSGLAAVLLALAMACAPDRTEAPGAPAPAEGGTAWFEEQARERGIDFTHRSGFAGQHLTPEATSGGAGLFDMDGDGDLDAYLVQSGSLVDVAQRRPGNQLFENVGDGRFRNVTEGSGADQEGYGMGVACGDYDDDGDVDLYVTNYGPNALLRNDGAGRFTDVTAEAGVGHEGWGTSAGFFDYDLDGDLDLYLVNYINWTVENELECFNQMGGVDYCGPKNYDSPEMDALFRNEGGGRFTDVTLSAGLGRRFGNGLGFVFGDFDSDGWPDIFVANDGLADQLWINQGNGRFEDNALLAGVAVDLEGGVPKAGMGVTTGDLDDDGDLDLMVCNLVNETDSIYRNEGTYFQDVTARSGVGTVSRHYTRFGMGWVDFDNDGLLDLYQANGRVRRADVTYSDDAFAEPNVLFRGVPGGRFEEVEPQGGTSPPLITTSRAAAFGDIDGDGGLDILVVNRDGPAHLLYNLVAARGNWIRFSARERQGRDAEGAALYVKAGDRTLRRDVRAGYSYQACNDPRVHFGLGKLSGVDEVRVVWPDGEEERFGPFAAGQTHDLLRGQGR